MFSLTLLLALQQPAQGLPPSPVARIAIMPLEPTVVAGDSLQLRAEAFDAQGRPVPGVRFMWSPGHSPSRWRSTPPGCSAADTPAERW